MKIQFKLSATYITLLSLGVILISGYAILSIRSFLLEEAIEKFESDSHTFAVSFESATKMDEQSLFSSVKFVSDLTGYNVAVFDSMGNQLMSYPEKGFVPAVEFMNDDIRNKLNELNKPLIINEEGLENLIVFEKIPKNSTPVRFLRISQPKKELYAADTSIRHLIYGAMLGSIIVVIIVSIYFAKYLSKPITQLKEAALDISNGNLDREINLARSDEFGTLAKSLNQMAGKLKADNNQLKVLNEKQNQFFADITHEVRNPLHSIAASLEMIELENLPKEKKIRYQNNAHRQIKRITRLFEDIKTLQRYDYDHEFINKKEFDVCEIANSVLDLHQPPAEEKNISLMLDSPSSITAFGDPDKIEQVLENLVSNAVKYTNEGEIKLIIKAEEPEKVRITIEDTGIGISAEHLERLFDRFYRTDKARSRDKGGTGLGLAVVKGILKAHNTEVEVQSKPGEGSTFSFTLNQFQL